MISLSHNTGNSQINPVITPNISPGLGVASGGQITPFSDTLGLLYNETKCGLNYTEGNVLIGKKMEIFGLNYIGVDQPAGWSTPI